MAKSDNVLVLGATSGMAREIAKELASGGAQLLLAGRDAAELERIAADLRVRYQVEALIEPFDALAFDEHQAFWNRCVGRFATPITGVVLCHGYLPQQSQAETDWAEARKTLDVNFTSAVSILNLAANYLASQGTGFIAAISSVAGDRGRQSNYLYGAAKAGLTAYLSGLRNRLYHKGVAVLTVKPGFVYTAMTAGLLKKESPMVASPEKVARDIVGAIRKRRNVIYTPWFWRPIMLIIGSVPEWLFKRLKM